MSVRVLIGQDGAAEPAEVGVTGRARHLVTPICLLYVGSAVGTAPRVALDPLARVMLLECAAEVDLPILCLHCTTPLLVQRLIGRLEPVQVPREDTTGGNPVPCPLAEHAEGKFALGAHGHVGVLLLQDGAATGGAGAVHHVPHGVQCPLQEKLLISVFFFFFWEEA